MGRYLYVYMYTYVPTVVMYINYRLLHVQNIGNWPFTIDPHYSYFWTGILLMTIKTSSLIKCTSLHRMTTGKVWA